MDSGLAAALSSCILLGVAIWLLHAVGVVGNRTSNHTSNHTSNRATPEPPPRSKNKSATLTLESLPTELILCVTDHLPAASRASLALASRPMLQRQGTAVLHLQDEDRYVLLEYLERDGAFPSQFLCSHCRRFHRPRLAEYWLSLVPNENVTYQPITLAEVDFSKKCEAWSYSTNTLLSFGLVAAVLRSRRLRNSIYPPELLESQAIHTLHESPGILIRCTRAPRIRGARVYLKTEYMYYSATPRDCALKSVSSLRRITAKHPDLENLCDHFNWPSVYGNLLRGGERDVQRRFQCVWSHPSSCRAAKCGWRKADLQVRGCSDLGRGLDVRDQHWTSHTGEWQGNRPKHSVGAARRAYQSSS